MNKWIAILLITTGLCGYAYYKGRESAFYDISIEKCSVDSNRDISCYTWINK